MPAATFRLLRRDVSGDGLGLPVGGVRSSMVVVAVGCRLDKQGLSVARPWSWLGIRWLVTAQVGYLCTRVTRRPPWIYSSETREMRHHNVGCVCPSGEVCVGASADDPLGSRWRAIKPSSVSHAACSRIFLRTLPHSRLIRRLQALHEDSHGTRDSWPLLGSETW